MCEHEEVVVARTNRDYYWTHTQLGGGATRATNRGSNRDTGTALRLCSATRKKTHKKASIRPYKLPCTITALCKNTNSTPDADLEVGRDDLQGVSEEINPLHVRPRGLHCLHKLGALEFEEGVRVSLLHRTHEPEHGTHQPFPHTVGTFARRRAQVEDGNGRWRLAVCSRRARDGREGCKDSRHFTATSCPKNNCRHIATRGLHRENGSCGSAMSSHTTGSHTTAYPGIVCVMTPTEGLSHRAL